MTKAPAGTQTTASLLAAAAHDLRQPLQGMSLLTGSLVVEPDEHARSEIGQRMTAAIASLQAMLQLLIDLAQTESQGLPAAESCDLDALLRELLAELQAVAAYRGGDLSLTQHGTVLKTAPRLLREAIRGLVLHAFWLRPSTTVGIAARTGTAGITIEVLTTTALPNTHPQRTFTELPYVANDRLALSAGLGLRLVAHVAALLGFALVIEPADPGTRLALVAVSPAKS